MKEFKIALRKFIRKIRDAKDKNLNEADTRMRVRLLLSDVLGYDLLDEITQEHMISGHYVDLTVKHKGEIIFFVEVKSIDTTLRDTHAYQVVNYAATGGVNLCLLTNGVDYNVYHLTWDKSKVENSLILSFNILNDDTKEVAEKLYLLSKDSFRKGLINKYVVEVTSLEDKNLLQALLSRRVLNAVRLELKHITGHKIKDEAIEKCISSLFSNELYEVTKACLKRREKKAKNISEKIEGEPMSPTLEQPEHQAI